MLKILNLLLVLFISLPLLGNKQPNIIVIIYDDLNKLISPYDNQNVTTANLKRISDAGITFTNAYANSTMCNPSRSSFLTGLYPDKFNYYGNYRRTENGNVNYYFRDSLQNVFTINDYFHYLGYKVFGAGKIYHDPFNQKEYWDQYNSGGNKPQPSSLIHPESANIYNGLDWGPLNISQEQFPEYEVTSFGINRVEHPEPYIMLLGYRLPHTRLYYPNFVDSRVNSADLSSLDSDLINTDHLASSHLRNFTGNPAYKLLDSLGQISNFRNAYEKCVYFTDLQIGRIYDKLLSTNFFEDSYLIITSDHGYNLGEKSRIGKDNLWKNGQEIPMIIIGPNIQPGRKVAVNVSLIDLLPTLLDLVDVESPGALDGESFKSYLHQEMDTNRPVLAVNSKKTYSVISNNHKLIEYPQGEHEYYNIVSDKNELNNLASLNDFEEHKEMIAQFKNRNPYVELGVIDSIGIMTNELGCLELSWNKSDTDYLYEIEITNKLRNAVTFDTLTWLNHVRLSQVFLSDNHLFGQEIGVRIRKVSSKQNFEWSSEHLYQVPEKVNNVADQPISSWFIQRTVEQHLILESKIPITSINMFDLTGRKLELTCVFKHDGKYIYRIPRNHHGLYIISCTFNNAIKYKIKTYL